ncbi:MAG: tRNA 2-thiouridine(34) synthase MnmA [Ruminococcaceae bacterium]|nr:tRNA 2-thiouridine(34) synthase MnmA [Oscillospiraceae bacterium]
MALAKSVVIGISGGVDSAVSALLLKQAGYDVFGAYIMMHEHSADGIEDARAVCNKIDIPFLTVDAYDIFKENVEKYFCDTYLSGRTPNPCIFCNPTVKFQILLDFAQKNNIENIATGHYTGVAFDERWYIIPSNDKKDQSYFLYRLTQQQLSKLIFPLFNKSKDEVRLIAKENELPVFNKKDSQEICFIKNEHYTDYIFRKTGASSPSGSFILTSGEKVGTHKGILNYTIGQRKNLGVALGKPVFVKEIDAQSNNIILSFEDVTNCKEIYANNLVFQRKIIQGKEKYRAKIRFSAISEPCTVERLEDDLIKIVFDNSVRAATKGQSAVIYDNFGIVGGGIICN